MRFSQANPFGDIECQAHPHNNSSSSHSLLAIEVNIFPDKYCTNLRVELSFYLFIYFLAR
jgi:hypothetical protein